MSSDLSEPPAGLSERINNLESTYQNLPSGSLSEAYEEFRKEVSRAEAAAYKGQAGELVLERIAQLEQLFAKFSENDNKELAMFMSDSEALRSTAQIASLNAENIKIGEVGGLTPDEFLDVWMKNHISPGLSVADLPDTSHNEDHELFRCFDWEKDGRWFYTQSKIVYPNYFVFGPLATKRRKITKQRRVDDTGLGPRTTAQQMTADTMQEQQEQSTSHMVKSVFRVLHDRAGSGKVNFFSFVINPKSFGQSVENMFYLSFLLRDGKVRIDEDEDGTPFIAIVDEDEVDEVPEDAPYVHHIATFDHTVWRAAIEAFEIQDAMIPHRGVPEEV